MAERRVGACLCGAVSYRAEGLRDIWFCHCTQCRKATGHYMAACRTEKNRLHVDGAIVWSHHSGVSQIARCCECGSPLFWEQPDSPTISVIAGSLDDTTGLATPGHIFLAEKGHYYAVADSLPQWAGVPDGGC